MILSKGKTNVRYTIENISSNKEMQDFLFTLGCYPGEEITLISKLASNYIIAVKDSRYSIDSELAKAIDIKSEETESVKLPAMKLNFVKAIFAGLK